MSHASVFDLVLFVAVPILLWKWPIKRLLAKWETVRGVTGLKFVRKREDPDA